MIASSRAKLFVDSWLLAAKNKQLDALGPLFAAEATLISPISAKPQTGTQAILPILAAVMKVLPDLTYSRCETTDTGAVLTFAATMEGGMRLEGLDYFTLRDDGLITELKVFVRPLKAATAFADGMRLALGS